MAERRGCGWLGVAGLALGASLWLLAFPGLAQVGSLTLDVDCAADPERTTVTNLTDQALDLADLRLGSLYEPGENEPFTLPGGSLPTGGSITYLTGAAAPTGTLTLTQQFIYDDEVASEGAGLDTPFGRLEVLCSEGTGALVVGQGAQPTVAPVPTLATPTAAIVSPTTAPVATPTAIATAAPPPTTGDVARPGTAVPRSPAAPAPGLPATGGGAMGMGLLARPLLGLGLLLCGLVALLRVARRTRP
jgi:hypothetical protein